MIHSPAKVYIPLNLLVKLTKFHLLHILLHHLHILHRLYALLHHLHTSFTTFKYSSLLSTSFSTASSLFSPLHLLPPDKVQNVLSIVPPHLRKDSRPVSKRQIFSRRSKNYYEKSHYWSSKTSLK